MTRLVFKGIVHVIKNFQIFLFVRVFKELDPFACQRIQEIVMQMLPTHITKQNSFQIVQIRSLLYSQERIVRFKRVESFHVEKEIIIIKRIGIKLPNIMVMEIFQKLNNFLFT